MTEVTSIPSLDKALVSIPYLGHAALWLDPTGAVVQRGRAWMAVHFFPWSRQSSSLT
jgi:hypothetical protein